MVFVSTHLFQFGLWLRHGWRVGRMGVRWDVVQLLWGGVSSYSMLYVYFRW